MAFKGFNTLFAADSFAARKRRQGFRARVTGMMRGFAYGVIYTKMRR